MRRDLIATAVISSALTLVAVTATTAATQKKTVKLENAKVRVTEVVYEPGQPRERYIRPTDQVIVFLDDSRYERIDSKTGEKTIRERKSGEVIWHDKGEDAPILTNLGKKAYRSLTIELLK
ncbi:MAG: hypothetical protein FJW40_15045 [Acidobacteria bacterium]|nr:hypothetical protein [Acidobacteriota bacterium]